MGRIAQLQMNLPQFEADGATHARGCECPRCEAGFRPSEGQRKDAKARWRGNEIRDKAEAAVQRMKAKQQTKALKMELYLGHAADETDRLLQTQETAEEKARRDPKMEELLRLRAQGVPISDALALVEGRLTAKRPRRATPVI